MSLDKMNKIIDFDTDNATITVEAGVVIKDLQDTVEKQGLFYPLDPASLNICTIGGNVAENAGGPRALKYGVTRDYVIGLKGVWANGASFELGGKQMKNVAGYDLIGLLVGSEGTLAVITEITLKLIPKPTIVLEALCGFDDPLHAANALASIRTSGVQPSTAEYMLDICVQASASYMEINAQFPAANTYIIWQVDGTDTQSAANQLLKIEQICQKFKSVFWQPMDSVNVSNHVWSIRRNISLGLRKMAGNKCSEDIVVPPASVPECIKKLQKLQHECGIRVIGYGHLGDGNIHVNILKMSASDQDWALYKDEMVASVMELAVSMGGTISGEHGIGLTKKQFMPLVFTSNDLDIMKSIKKIIDPNHILNPGKVFDIE